VAFLHGRLNKIFVFPSQATYLGQGDLHESGFDDTAVVVPFRNYEFLNSTSKAEGHCMYDLIAYSSQEYKNATMSDLPVALTVVVAGVFALVALTFFAYDRFVKRRNDIVIDAAG